MSIAKERAIVGAKSRNRILKNGLTICQDNAYRGNITKHNTIQPNGKSIMENQTIKTKHTKSDRGVAQGKNNSMSKKYVFKNSFGQIVAFAEGNFKSVCSKLNIPAARAQHCLRTGIPLYTIATKNALTLINTQNKNHLIGWTIEKI